MKQFWANLDPQRRTAFSLLGVVFLMGSLAWASVPAYRIFCQITGWGGAVDVATEASEEILDEVITIRFDSSKAAGVPIQVRPVETHMDIRIGEEGLAFYEAYNPTDKVIATTASYNVAPFSAGAFFSKIQCFCFELQVLQPGERVMMPVSFFVESDIVDDPDARFAKTITLSYTFHETDLTEDYAPAQAALELGDSTTEVN